MNNVNKTDEQQIDGIPVINRVVVAELKKYKDSNDLNSEVLSRINYDMDKMVDTWCTGDPEKVLGFMDYMRRHCESVAKMELKKATQYGEIAKIIEETLENNK